MHFILQGELIFQGPLYTYLLSADDYKILTFELSM